MRKPAGRERAKHRRHVVVQLEVLAGGPFVVDLARARVEARAVAAHLLDDVPRVRDEDRRVVRRLSGRSSSGAALATAWSNRDASTSMPCRAQNA